MYLLKISLKRLQKLNETNFFNTSDIFSRIMNDSEQTSLYIDHWLNEPITRQFLIVTAAKRKMRFSNKRTSADCVFNGSFEYFYEHEHNFNW